MRRAGIFSTALVIAVAWLPSQCWAQSRQPPGRKRPPPGASKGTAGPVDPSINSSVDLLTAWLDDAETPERGGGYFSMSIGRWQAIDAAQSDVPVLEVGQAVTDHVQLIGTLPVSRTSYADGSGTSGRGDVYLMAKVQLVDPSEHAVGLAVSPLIEILSDAVALDPALNVRRVNWALPVTLHVAGEHNAVYGTATYFSRGIASVGLEVEHELSKRLTLGGFVTYGYATRLYFETTSQTIDRSRTDAGGEAYIQLTDTVTLVGGLGRTVSTLDINAAKLIASVGLQVEWKRKKQ